MVFLYSFLTIRINQTSMTFLRKNLFCHLLFFLTKQHICHKLPFETKKIKS